MQSVNISSTTATVMMKKAAVVYERERDSLEREVDRYV